MCQTLTDQGPRRLHGEFCQGLQTLTRWLSLLFVTLIFLCFNQVKPYLLLGDCGHLLPPVVVQICLSVPAEHVWACVWDTCVFTYTCMCVTRMRGPPCVCSCKHERVYLCMHVCSSVRMPPFGGVYVCERSCEKRSMSKQGIPTDSLSSFAA